PPDQDQGSDLDSDIDPNENFEPDVNQALTKIWRQFLLDIANRSSNPKANVESAYVKLSDIQKLAVTDETYQNLHLSDFFKACHWKVGTRAEWSRTFTHLFPVRGDERSGSTQNYKNMTYWLDWTGDYLNNSNIPNATIHLMRKHLYKRFNKLRWMPLAQRERVWVSKKPIVSLRSYPETHTTAAPWVLIAPRHEPTFD
ncbi:hypothetical protein CPB83DRAFT_900692, partial [Crepidotus variabilis]